MRRLGILLRLIPFVCLAVSCSVSRTVSRTAKVEHLVPDMVVMPLVTELDVSPYPYVQDTVVVRRLFDRSTTYATHKHLEAALTEALMKRTGADILVEPQLTAKTTYRGVGNTIYMTLRAYPAHYISFRTVTEGDAKMLNSLKKKEQVGEIRLSRLLGSELSQVAAIPEDISSVSDEKVTAEQKVEVIKSEVPKDSKKSEKHKIPRALRPPYSRPVGYRGIYEVGGGGPVSSKTYFNDGQMWFHTSQGVNFTPCFFIGGGCGFEWHGRYSDYSDNSNYNNYYLIPLYAHMRLHFWDHRVAPYFDLRLGISGVIAGGSNDAARFGKPYWYGVDPFLSTGLGFSFGRFSIGAEYSLGLDYFMAPDWSDVCIRLGFTF